MAGSVPEIVAVVVGIAVAILIQMKIRTTVEYSDSANA